MGLFKPNLKRMAKKRDVKGFIRALRYRKDQEIRRVAASVLGILEDPRAVEPLIGALSDSAYSVRVAAVKSLAAIDDARAVEPLIQVMQGKNAARDAAMEALVTIGQPAVGPLIQALRDQTPLVRETAAYLLIILRESGAPGVEWAEPNLIEALQDQLSDVRKAAAVALSVIGGAQAVGPMIQALKDPDADVRKIAAAALGSMKSTQGVAPLAEALEDVDQQVRKAAVKALGAIGGGQAVAPLVKALKDNENEVQKTAIGAFEKIGEPAIAALEKALEKNGRIQEGAAKALDALAWKPKSTQQEAYYCIAKDNWDRCVQIGVPAVEPLIGVLNKDSSYRKRRDAVKALGAINDARVEKVLIGALKDVDTEVRVAAVDALGEIGDKRAVEPIIAMLKNPNRKYPDGVWTAAMKTLGVCGGEPAVGLLMEALKYDAMIVRKAAADALDGLGWKPDTEEHHAYYCIAKSEWEQCAAIGAPAAEPLLELPRAAMCNAAIEALGQIGDARAVKLILGRMESDEWKTRKTAALALLSIAEKNPDVTIVNSAIMKKIRTAHQDRVESWSDNCGDTSMHVDTGIGLSRK